MREISQNKTPQNPVIKSIATAYHRDNVLRMHFTDLNPQRDSDMHKGTYVLKR